MKQIVVVGGGAGGYFTAINLGLNTSNCKIYILEKHTETLRKVRVSGGGRCNVTNACFEPNLLVKNYPRGEKALLGPFSRFGPKDTINWFNDQGIEIIPEEDGRMFPSSNKSSTIIQCFTTLINDLNINLLTSCKIQDIKQDGEQWTVQSNYGKIVADFLVLAGGSSSDLWDICKTIGHTVESPVPSLFSFNIKHPLLEGLQGVSFKKIKIKLETKKFECEGPAVITHWGISGPAVLKLSAWEAKYFYDVQYKTRLVVNWTNAKNLEIAKDELKKARTIYGSKQCISNPAFGLPSRFWIKICSLCDISQGITWSNISNAQVNSLADLLYENTLDTNGKTTNKDEFVTCGGISLKEIDFRTMQSKISEHLYFVGEILDIDGITGGFNFQAAWTGGWLAAKSIAEKINM